MFRDASDIKLLESLIESSELLLKSETDPKRIAELKEFIADDKSELQNALKQVEKAKEVRELAKARVGKVTALGEFQVNSKKLRITDPCYSKDTWCAGSLKNPLQGKWLAFIQYRDEGNWGIRNSTVFAVHENSPLKDQLLNGHLYENHLDTLADIDVGVDSGQAGIFDEAQYPNGDPGEYNDDKSFYGRACNATLGDYDNPASDNLRAGVITEGVVSSSGDGDGSYRCFYNKDTSGKVDAVEISFYWHQNERDESEDE